MKQILDFATSHAYIFYYKTETAIIPIDILHLKI